MKTLLIAISTIILLLLFTSCEKEEMTIGGTGGGGKEDANTITKSAPDQIPKVDESTLVAGTSFKN